jgi:hypothetical protein
MTVYIDDILLPARVCRPAAWPHLTAGCHA